MGRSPTDSENVPVTLILTGGLRDFQDNPLGRLSVELFDGTELISELETGNEGEFSFRFTTEDFGVHDLSARFAEQDFMTTATANVELEVLINTFATVSLEGPLDAGRQVDFTVELVDENGVPVESGLVEVSSNASGTTSVPVVNGRAQGTLTFENSGGVTVTAVYQPEGSYVPSQALKRSHVRMPTRLEIAVETEPAIFEDFEVTGRLLNVFGQPLPGKSVGLERSDGEESQRAVTADDGSFVVSLSTASPGELTLSAGFFREGDFNGATSEITVDVMPVVLQTALPSFLIRGEPGVISGIVYRGTQPFGGETVLLELDGRPVGQTQSDAGGNFTAKVQSENDSPLGLRRLTVRLPRVGFVETVSVPIKSRTSIITDGPESAHEGSDLRFTILLLDDHDNPVTGQPLMGAGVDAGSTDASGSLLLEHSVPQDLEADSYAILLAYPGSDHYLPVEKTVLLEITPRPPIFLMSMMAAVLLVLIGGSSTGFLVARSRRRSRLRWATGVAGEYDLDEILGQDSTDTLPDTEIQPSSTSVEIEHQERPLEDTVPALIIERSPTRVVIQHQGRPVEDTVELVTGDALNLEVLTLDREEHPIVAPIFVQRNDEPPTQAEGKEGRTSLRLQFPHEGRYLQRAIFPGSAEFLPSVGQVEIIVRLPTRISIEAGVRELAPDGRIMCLQGESLTLSVELQGTSGETISGSVPVRLDGAPMTALQLLGRPVPLEADTSNYGTHRIIASFEGDELHLPSRAELEFVVPTPTRMVLEPPPARRPAAAVEGQEVVVWRLGEELPCVVILQDVEGNPLSLPVVVNLDGAPTARLATQDGRSAFPVDIQQAGLHRISASFAGNGDYLPSSDEALVKMPKPTTVHVSLPDLREDIPRVWGVHDPLDVHVTLTDSDGVPVERPVRLEGTGLSMDLTLPGGTGYARVNYHALGEAEINVIFAGDEDFEEVSAVTSVEIVNLGEEIVQMYERFVRWARPKIPRLPRDATPRDRARAVAQVVDQGTASSSWEITGLMEVAEYSLHRITTDDYAAMYLAIRSLGIDLPKEG